MTFKQPFTVMHYELDHRGKLSAPFLCRMLQEAAGNDACNLGIDSPRLHREHGLAWVLARFHCRIEQAARWPRWRDKLEVSSWRVSHDRFLAVRDYRVSLAGDQQAFAVGTSSWAMFDVTRRRMAAIPQFIADAHPKQAERALDSSFEKLPALERVDFERRISAGLRDIDQNDHVNNVAYINWAIEATPRELALSNDLVEAEVAFRAETKLDEELVVQGQLQQVGARTEALYEIKRASDGRMTTQLKLAWAKA